MPFDVSILPVFVLASLALLITPGPDMAFIVATGVAKGRRTAMFASAGIALAMFSHSVFAAIGVASLVKTHPIAFDVVRYFGALYMLYLAIKAFRFKPTKFDDQTTDGQAFEYFKRGYFTNLLNPKAVLFCAVFLPQFVSPSTGSILKQILGLGVALATIGFIFQILLSALSGSLGVWLLSSAKRQIILERIMGLVFFALAARLLTMTSIS
jgi:threonine/homoserine/homoserine lactone efflux protein